MLIDWTHWISSLHRDEAMLLFAGVLVVDGPRYAVIQLLVFLWDYFHGLWRWCWGTAGETTYDHCPTVCAVLAGLNEADTITASLDSLWGTYPRLEIIVVDDGSDDDMLATANCYASDHAGILVLRKPERGGKSSCINFALNYTSAEVIVIVDTDSHLEPGAIWEIVQPLKDPRVGAVSATVLVRNAFTNLLTCFQAHEYLHSILVGRIASARLGLLNICSGAFSAFRRTAVDRAMGWDVGPGEDGDFTMRIRKAGYNVAFAPYAQCMTNVPEKWRNFFRQRRRWNRGAIRYKCRKHIDMAYFWSPNFRITNLLVLLNIWFYSIFCLYAFWLCAVMTVLKLGTDTWKLCMAAYVGWLAVHAIQAVLILYYSTSRLRDGLICFIIPLAPAYQVFRKLVRLVAVTEELFFRRSFHDTYVPPRVRAATWHW